MNAHQKIEAGSFVPRGVKAGCASGEEDAVSETAARGERREASSASGGGLSFAEAWIRRGVRHWLRGSKSMAASGRMNASRRPALKGAS